MQSFFVKIKTLISNIYSTSHFIKAVQRFDNRLGNHFGAAISFYSILSLIPILMVIFAIAGYMLSSDTSKLFLIINEMIDSLGNDRLSDSLKSMLNTAIQQRTSVGITGLIIALFTGFKWIGSIREALCAQTRNVWEQDHSQKRPFLKQHLIDFIALIGMVFILIISIILTTLSHMADNSIHNIMSMLNLDVSEEISVSFSRLVSMMINIVLFMWIYWLLPQKKFKLITIFLGSLYASIVFEILKLLISQTFPLINNTLSGATFGSIFALMIFFYIFARIILFFAAWIATAKE